MNKPLHEYLIARQPVIEAKQLRLPGYERPQPYRSIKILVAEDNYTRLHLFDQPHPLMVCQTLKRFADQMPDFVRANKATLVNPSIIRRVIILNPKQMELELASGELITVSRRRMDTVLVQLSLPPLAPRRRSVGRLPI